MLKVGRSALILASELGRTSIVELLRAQPNVEVNAVMQVCFPEFLTNISGDVSVFREAEQHCTKPSRIPMMIQSMHYWLMNVLIQTCRMKLATQLFIWLQWQVMQRCWEYY